MIWQKKTKTKTKCILWTPSKADPWDEDGEKWHDQKYIKRTPSNSDPRQLWPLRHLVIVLRRQKSDQRAKTKTKTMTNTYEIEVWNCCHFRQLRTWVHDNHCYLGIKSDTGQHSQFLRCLMHIYDKQCGIMQKNQWKGPNFQIQCFYNGTSGALCWERQKNTKTRETKTQITQIFEKIWPI